MSEQDRYIPGVPCWIDTTQPDPDAAAAFYGDLFGWKFDTNSPVAAEVSQAGNYGFVDRMTTSDGTGIPGGVGGGTGYTGHAISYVGVPDVMDAGRMAVFTDPEGAAFCVWQAKEHRGARIVNEPGSLNFNGLNTRDAKGAKSFYGAVFGWDLLDVGGGSMWALPAYGDFLERRTPGLRQSMVDMSAPARFEEVVAGIMPIPDDQPDVPANWSVTFAVDDADAIAARATELGGTVVVPPFDAPWVRMTIVRDPQGATFTASKFVAENKDLAQSPGAVASG